MTSPTWRQVNATFPNWKRAETDALAGLAPLLSAAEDKGTLNAWFFIRKRPCWRVRYLTTPGAHDPIGKSLDALLAEGTITAWTEIIYEPETHTFGGTEAMASAHRFFHRDSRGIINSLWNGAGGHHRETSLMLCSLMMRARRARLDLPEDPVTHSPALKATKAVADLLATPETAPVSPDMTTTHRQHLAYGPTGIALLHIERAACGLGPWRRAHDWLVVATRLPFISGPDSHPYYGAPALAYVVACAAAHRTGLYQGPLVSLDAQITADAGRRLDAAHRRLDAGLLPQLAEFDTIRGLSGYGAYLLRRDPDGPALRAVLDYCVRLTEPITDRDDVLPGWWTASGSSGHPDETFPGGHANTGLAHGIGGVLALLALSARQGIRVSGQHDAVRTILAWLDRWQEESGHGPAWPYWITRAELRDAQPAPYVPRRPSWCYGTAGVARAQQLAALALNDSRRQIEAENALVGALTDTAQLKATTDHGLCYGTAGLAHIASRMSDGAHPSTAGQLRALVPALHANVCPAGTDPANFASALLHAPDAGPGFLNGAAGIALALHSPATAQTPRSAWDACLLIA
ncbi:lanthionine synthetase [Streptomyces roseirectus]|uniref:Lanthionine synthetase n=1 Tax=Streptomyces roseirectus TaxID=2768066 RepID=A0A7H0IQ99_9ACTN|nr:thiopeptide-type bacteriocin biosynthesis protein [Streptomyces roseirectus]QNP74965.1 lanthionine synthetase [Streptomyces roseirectus]